MGTKLEEKFDLIRQWRDSGANVVFWPGRAKFPHVGHVSYLKALHDKGYKLLIGNGSCYTIDPRNPVHAFQIQVMLAQSLLRVGIPASDFLFVPIPDFATDEAWQKFVTNIPNFSLVTHLATDNPEVVTALNEWITRFNIQFLKREDVITNPIEINATRLREALLKNDWKFFYEFAASGTIDFLNHAGDLHRLREAIIGNEINYEPGRQCADIFVFVFDGFGWQVLLGNRKKSKKDFGGDLACPGGGIDDYESPQEAVLRELEEETGLISLIMAPNTLPYGIVLAGKMGALHFVKMYATRDKSLAGSQGGSSLCFMTVFDGGRNELSSLIIPHDDLEDVRLVKVEDALREGLAFQQTQMLRDCYAKLQQLREER